MRRLGYERYVSQGGDWGGIVTHALARQAPPGLLAFHTNFPGTVPREIAKALQSGDPAPTGLPPDEKAAYEQLTDLVTHGSGYAAMLSTRPQTEGYGLTDSPVGLAAFFCEKFAAWADSGGEPERVLTYDEMLDDITLYWLRKRAARGFRSAATAARPTRSVCQSDRRGGTGGRADRRSLRAVGSAPGAAAPVACPST